MIKKIYALILGAFLCMPLPAKANEGAGLLTSDLDGALPKSLWAGQPRSEITYLLKNLPPQGPSPSAQKIKRNMLISTYDISLMDDDVPKKKHENLLMIRLKKLYQMGLWEDALKLYSKTANSMAENDPFSQTGVVLILNQKGLPSACLESKVIGQNFESVFWKNMETICLHELENMKAEDVEIVNSTVLQAALTEPKYKITANNLEKLSPLELTIVHYKKQISFDGLELKENTPPYVLKYYIEEAELPADQKDILKRLNVKNFPFPESNSKNDNAETVKQDKDPSQKQLIQTISETLKTGKSTPKNTLDKLAELAPQNPENYFYIQILNHISETSVSLDITEEQKAKSESAFSTTTKDNYNFLNSILDIEAEFSNNPGVAYEKQGESLQKADKVRWLGSTLNSRLEGLTLLLVLSNNDTFAYANKSGDKPQNNTVNVLKSLSIVGLIDQANLIAREELAKLMVLKLKEK